MCITIWLIKSFHYGHATWRSRITNILNQLFTFKYCVWISATLIMIIARLWAMDFEKPQFKAMDNPVAASDDFTTRVGFSYFLKLIIKAKLYIFYQALSQCFLYALNVWILLCPDWLSFDWALGSIQLIENWSDIRMIPTALVFLAIVMLSYFGRRYSVFA